MSLTIVIDMANIPEYTPGLRGGFSLARVSGRRTMLSAAAALRSPIAVQPAATIPNPNAQSA